MEKVLITGGAGFLGSHLGDKLIAEGKYVIAVDMSRGEKVEHLMGHDRFRFIQGSVLDRELMTRVIDGCDIVFHFAAIADPKRYVMEPLTTLEIDLRGSLVVLDITARKRIKFVYASTSEIYGRNPSIPWREDSDRVIGPTSINRWCYASAKAAVEHYCYAYGHQEGLRFVIIRPFNVYGPRLDDLGSGRVIPVFLKNFFMNKPVMIHGDGKQTRCLAFVDDIVEGISLLAFSGEAEQQAFNVGSTRETSILELAEIMKEVGGFSSPFQFIPYQEVFGESFEDVPRRVPDVAKVKEVVGWEAKTSLEDGLRVTIDYYRQRRDLP